MLLVPDAEGLPPVRSRRRSRVGRTAAATKRKRLHEVSSSLLSADSLWRPFTSL